MSENGLSQTEAENCVKVKKLLLEIPGLGVKSIREDLFLVTEPETEVEFTVDVEETLLFVRAEVAQLPAEVPMEFYKFLLEQNARIVHVAFGLDGDQLILKGNLEIENLDPNELEATCKSLIVTLFQASDELAKYLGI